MGNMTGIMFPGTIVPIIIPAQVAMGGERIGGNCVINRAILTFVGCWSLVGCASQMNMTYYCVPSGATLLESGRFIGQCPGTYSYPISPDAKQTGVLRTAPVTARWPSGATVTVQAITAHLQTGYSQNFTFTRPADAPGAELDYQASADFEARIAAQQNQLGYDMGLILGRALAK